MKKIMFGVAFAAAMVFGSAVANAQVQDDTTKVEQKEKCCEDSTKCKKDAEMKCCKDSVDCKKAAEKKCCKEKTDCKKDSTEVKKEVK